MTEQYRDIHEFDGIALGDALNATGHLRSTDVAHGAGHTLDVGERQTVLEVYPDAAVARVTTRNARIELFRVPGYTVDADEGRVVFEHGQEGSGSRLVVRETGDVHLYPFEKPGTALESGESNATSQEG